MSTLKDMLPSATDGHVLHEDAKNVTSALESHKMVLSSGRPSSSRVLTLPMKNDEADYSAIVKQGENALRVVHTTLDAMTERNLVSAPLPTKEEAEETARKTRVIIEKVLATTSQKIEDKPSFIRYTPANTNTDSSTKNRQRIIKLVDTPADPMEPPRHSHRKAPVNPPSPPVPVLHSPDRKLSKKEAAEWKIPPVVSNWKNNRGYTISLDKRLAADGRGLVDHSINDRFATFAEAMYTAERDARTEVETRAKLQRQAHAKVRDARQRELRQLAERARQERKGFLGIDVESTIAPSEAGFASEREEPRPVEDDAPPVLQSDRELGDRSVRRRSRESRFGEGEGSLADVDHEVRRRDEIRAERKMQRDREFRKRDLHSDNHGGPMLKRTKLTRDQDRDLSEQVALGQSVGATTAAEVMYDQRLFNQDGGASRRGTSLAGGYGPDDAYSLYDKPLFLGANSSAKFQYRGSGATDVDERERRFQADRGFAGTNKDDKQVPHETRDRPVEFERDSELKSSVNDDPYGLDKFLNEAKQSKE